MSIFICVEAGAELVANSEMTQQIDRKKVENNLAMLLPNNSHKMVKRVNCQEKVLKMLERKKAKNEELLSGFQRIKLLSCPPHGNAFWASTGCRTNGPISRVLFATINKNFQ
ncbi:MAG: hypothetical protein ACPH5R_06970 [Candidatus Puniceispirillaceae bacterium]